MRVTDQHQTLCCDPIYRLLFSGAPANRYGRLRDRGRVQLDSVGFCEAKLSANCDCRPSANCDLFVSAALVLAKDRVGRWGNTERAVATAAGTLPCSRSKTRRVLFADPAFRYSRRSDP